MLQLNNVYKSYWQGKSEIPILKNISLEIQEGEYISIMGPSGSGKSTLMNIIGCLDKATTGDYLLYGKNVRLMSEKELAKLRNHSIGFVFQTFNLMPRLTALQNVELPLVYAGVSKKERSERARSALQKVGLEDRQSFKPPTLSGGQKQRVAIARALVTNPAFILADEPTGALDTKTGEQVMKLFSDLNKEGVTVIVITHEAEIAAYTKRKIMIRDGELMSDEGSEQHA
ncbi:ABC transporter ATP-binding protein [Listeria ivanovii]|uniref:ABC transporter ATP-binding protein n=2 Tax=Listeria ivanovii TaxID=1638 RepID=A0ABS1G1J9_LISIV|nr:ABC transporter ATP-binding protein [Listeria ivanovii]EFR97487.1 macrolide export ATP-binding/permease protein MacB [Listeria ivanovii FSL F6-596]AIS59386.1 macrolide ABC transporter ATP-binding protein [Listeria ivanovii subsp. londoniensis]MBC2255699.1 ABC transporter ATP-binding protein [Listeria ivanovii]MBK1960747.1 ABC transporter ATP-binding protein [Listeria ivanovii subsp. londoniensis]MBK2003534.1 ABC transporter ATP-binding protein [Listeria ivanovii subsp. londoniensis]